MAIKHYCYNLGEFWDVKLNKVSHVVFMALCQGNLCNIKPFVSLFIGLLFFYITRMLQLYLILYSRCTSSFFLTIYSTTFCPVSCCLNVWCVLAEIIFNESSWDSFPSTKMKTPLILFLPLIQVLFLMPLQPRSVPLWLSEPVPISPPNLEPVSWSEPVFSVSQPKAFPESMSVPELLSVSLLEQASACSLAWLL